MMSSSNDLTTQKPIRAPNELGVIRLTYQNPVIVKVQSMYAFYTLSLTQLTQGSVPHSRRPRVGLTLSYVLLWD